MYYIPSPTRYDPDKSGHFGKFGGRYVPETLMPALLELSEKYNQIRFDKEFWREVDYYLKDYVGRPSPLYYAANISKELDAKIYLKREDLNHTGAHKVNNVIAQGLMAQKLGYKKVIAETGAGQHGVATATIAALLGLECEIFMGAKDVARPHPYPLMVRDFQAIIGWEARAQILQKENHLPDFVVACIGGGSNAIGAFTHFLDDENVRCIGVEAGGLGLDTTKHGCSLEKGRPGVLHGQMSYLLQDDDGQILEAHSISAGLDYPGIGPEHAFHKENNSVSYGNATDKEALDAFVWLSQKEGIIPAFESAHAIAYLKKIEDIKGKTVIVNLSGRGDKDMIQAKELLHFD